MEARNSLAVNLKITFVIMFFMLFLRFLTVYGLAWLFKDVQPIWLEYYLYASMYVLTAITIWLNKNNLESLHIDKPFIVMFIGSGILLLLFYVPIQVGVFIGITAYITFQMLYRNRFIFGITHLHYRQIIGQFILSLIVLFVPVSILAFVFHSDVPWGRTPIDLALFRGGFPNVIYEEILFRGMLWMFLSHLKLSERKILYIQAFLFWISHYYFYSKIYTFWVAFPIVSLLFGIMVQRSKSLTPSTISHFVINVLLR